MVKISLRPSECLYIILEGFGLTLIYLLAPISIVLSPGQQALYHSVLPLTTIAQGLLIDLMLMGTLCGLGGLLLARTEGWRWLSSSSVTFGALTWVMLRDYASRVHSPQARARLLKTSPLAAALVIALVIAVGYLRPEWVRRIVRLCGYPLAAAGVVAALFIVPRLAVAAVAPTGSEQAFFQRSDGSRGHTGQRRIVWLLFDELSYRQVFEHRNAALHLPAFDALAKQSIIFSQLQPIGFQTQVVVPSLLLGQPMTDVRADRQGVISWRDTGGWTVFDPYASVFRLAQRKGWSTGVAGWYNPYCRMLAPVLNRCWWSYSDAVANELFSQISSRRSALGNAAAALPLAARFHLVRTQSHRTDYDNGLTQAKDLIADSSVEFAFIHLPVPHLPAIATAADGATAATPGYLGNLMLADHALATLEATIAASPAAADTVLIVCSDHSWRTWLVRDGPVWGAIEEAASDGGHFDPRPVLMVHLPGEHRSVTITRPESEMMLHTLLCALLQNDERDVKSLLGE